MAAASSLKVPGGPRYAIRGVVVSIVFLAPCAASQCPGRDAMHIRRIREAALTMIVQPLTKARLGATLSSFKVYVQLTRTMLGIVVTVVYPEWLPRRYGSVAPATI